MFLEDRRIHRHQQRGRSAGTPTEPRLADRKGQACTRVVLVDVSITRPLGHVARYRTPPLRPGHVEADHLHFVTEFLHRPFDFGIGRRQLVGLRPVGVVLRACDGRRRRFPFGQRYPIDGFVVLLQSIRAWTFELDFVPGHFPVVYSDDLTFSAFFRKRRALCGGLPGLLDEAVGDDGFQQRQVLGKGGPFVPPERAGDQTLGIHGEHLPGFGDIVNLLDRDRARSRY